MSTYQEGHCSDNLNKQFLKTRHHNANEEHVLGHFTHGIESPSHYTSSTLIGGKGGAGPILLHTMLEGQTE